MELFEKIWQGFSLSMANRFGFFPLLFLITYVVDTERLQAMNMFNDIFYGKTKFKILYLYKALTYESSLDWNIFQSNDTRRT